jgi:hypothetical protein
VFVSQAKVDNVVEQTGMIVIFNMSFNICFQSASSSIATEFAAKVAATLSHDSTNKATSSPAVNMQPSVDAHTLSSISESTSLKPSDVHAVDNSGNKLETAGSDTLLQTQLSTVEDTVDTATDNIPVPSAVASSCVPDMTTNEAVSVAVPIVDSKLITPESQMVVESVSDAKPVNTASMSDLSAQNAATEEVVTKPTAAVVTSEASSAVQIVAEKVAATKENVTDDSTGKRHFLLYQSLPILCSVLQLISICLLMPLCIFRTFISALATSERNNSA